MSQINKLILARYFQTHFLQDESARSKYLRCVSEDSVELKVRIQSLLSRDEHNRIEAEILKARDLGIVLLDLSDELYPSLWRRISYAPFLVSYMGTPAWNRNFVLAVVGSREASPWSLQWMIENLSPVVSSGKVILCSGGARGIDQKAHQICTLQKKPTLVVLPSGLGRIYPHQIKHEVELILESGGALISEYPLDQEIRKHHFQARNRLISGISIATLVVQAERKSGTLITARQTVEQGKPLWIVPSHPLDFKARGGLDLLQDGATPVVTAQELESFAEAEIRTWLWSDKGVSLGQEPVCESNH